MTDSNVPCIATERRLRWAMLRAGWPAKRREFWMSMGVTMSGARFLAGEAQTSTAALFLPDPSHWEMFRAYLHGKFRAVSGPPETQP